MRLQTLVACFERIRWPRVHACAMWIMGEYSTEISAIRAALAAIKAAMGPLLGSDDEEEGVGDRGGAARCTHVRPSRVEAQSSHTPAFPMVNAAGSVG